MFLLLFFACTEEKSTVVEDAPNLSETLGTGEVRLGVIQDESALFAGIAAEGTIGDFKLYNSQVQFIIQSDRKSSYYLQEGGGILDADIVREPGEFGRDIIDEHTVMAGLGRIMKPTSFELVSDGSDGVGHLRVYGTAIPFDLLQGAIENYDLVAPYDMTFQVDYTLPADSPLLRIETKIDWNDDDLPIQAANILLVGKEVLHHWNPGGGLEGSSSNQWHGLVSHQDEISLALMSEGEAFASSILQDLLTEATPAISSFTPSVIMEKGSSFTFTQLLGVGDDLSDLSDAWYAHNDVETKEFSGTVVDEQGNPISGARVQVYEQDDAITMTQTDAQGNWSVQVPSTVDARFVASGRGTRIFLDIPSQAGWTGPYTHKDRQQEVLASYGQEEDNPTFARGYGVGDWNESELVTPGILEINIQDGGPAVVKVFSEESQTSPFAPGNPHGTTQIGYVRDGLFRMPVEPGTYEVLVHRGTRYERVTQEVLIDSGQVSSVDVSLEPIRIPYSVFGVDAHSHSAPSGDGKVSMEGRVMSHAAHGVDISVSTEHDHAVDFAPLIQSLGLSSHLKTIIGSEVSPPMRGHFNSFPISVDKEEVNGGSPIWWDEKRDTDILFGIINEILEDDGVIQANHPVGSSGLFGSASYDLNFGEIDRPDYWSPNFGAFELLNDGQYESVLPYYIDMLSRGMTPTPMGVSDSHTAESGVGVNKTYVFAPDDSQESIMEAIRNQRVVASRGPIVAATISEEIAFGKTFVGAQNLVVEVFCPDWMNIDTVHVYENGTLIHDIAYDGSSLQVLLEPEIDAHYLVSVSGTQSMQPSYSQAPWAMGAAFFIDVDDNGWVPPLAPLAE